MTKRFWSALILVGFAVSIFEIVSTRHDRQRTNSEIDDLYGKLAQLRDATARAQASLDAAEKPLVEMPTKLSPPHEVSPNTNAATALALPADDGLILTHHPALRAKFERSIRTDLQNRYAAFFQRGNLSNEKIDKILNLMVRDAENELDLQGAAAARGVDLDTPGGARLREKQWTELLAAEKAILTPEQYEEFQQLQRREGVRPAIDELTSVVLFTGPFTATQIEQLLQVMAECSPEYRAGGRAVADTIDWQEALPRTASLLPEQQYMGVLAYANVIRRFQQVGDKVKQGPEPVAPGK